MASTTSAPTAPAPGFKPYNNIDEIAQAFLAGKLTEEQAISLMQGIWMEDGTFTADEAMNAAKLNLQSYKDKAGFGGPKTGPSVLDGPVVAKPTGTESPVPVGGGAVGPKGGALPGETMGPTDQSDLYKGYLENNPQAAYRRAFNLPALGANSFQEWLAGQFAPTYSSYAAQNLYNIGSGGPPSSFDNYLSEAGLTGARTAGLNTLGALRGRPSEEQNQFLSDFQSEHVDGSLSALLQSALQGRGFASPFARVMSRRVPALRQSYDAETLGGGLPGSQGFLDYLMNRTGLR